MKQLLSALGKILLVLAFLVTAAELAAHGMVPDLRALPSSGEVWAVLKPDQYQDFMGSNPNGLWLMALKVPAWALFGIPGFALVIACRDKMAGEDPELEQAMFLYDELAKRVEEEGFEDFSDLNDKPSDDMAPNHNVDISIADESYATSTLDKDLKPERDYLLGRKP